MQRDGRLDYLYGYVGCGAERTSFHVLCVFVFELGLTTIFLI
jgi:hypothetical protein